MRFNVNMQRSEEGGDRGRSKVIETYALPNLLQATSLMSAAAAKPIVAVDTASSTDGDTTHPSPQASPPVGHLVHCDIICIISQTVLEPDPHSSDGGLGLASGPARL